MSLKRSMYILTSTITVLVVGNSCLYFFGVFSPEGTFDWIKFIRLGLLLGLFVSIWVALWLDNTLSGNKRLFSILFRPSRFVDYVSWVSTAWASFVTGASMTLALFFFNRADETDIVSSPGFLYAGVALWVALWGFLNTIVIISFNKQKIASFRSFLGQVSTILIDWKYAHDNGRPENKKFYLVDYTPLIGSVSVPNSNEYKLFKTKLLEIADDEEIQTELRIICFEKTKIEEYHKRMNAPASLNDEVESYLRMLESHNGLFNKNVSIWRTSEVSPFHFLIADKGFEYIIKPESDTKNELMGSRTEDVFMLEFLRKTYEEFESMILTPKATLDANQKKIVLKFKPGQDNVAQLYLCKGRGDDNLEDTANKFSTQVGGELSEISIQLSQQIVERLHLEPSMKIADMLLRVIVEKRSGLRSSFSKPFRLEGAYPSRELRDFI